jgi:DNA polymerase III subunit epsilon
MSLVLGIDFESTDKDPETCRITEVGAILFDTQHHQFIRVMSELVYAPDYAESAPGAVDASGITDEMLKKWGSDAKRSLEVLLGLMQRADFVVAHNGLHFDRPLLLAELARHGLPPMPDIPWIDTLQDIPFPPKMSCRKLDHLVSDHNIPWDRRLSHRAVFDVAKMLLLLSAYDFEQILQYRNIPWVVLRALTTVPWRDKGVSNAKAKRLGFRWQEVGGEIYRDCWVKLAKENEVESEIKKARQEALTVIRIPPGAQ